MRRETKCGPSCSSSRSIIFLSPVGHCRCLDALCRLRPPQQSRTGGDEMRLSLVTLLWVHSACCFMYSPTRTQGAAAGRARGFHQTAVEAGRRLDHPLRCRRCYGHHSRRRHHGDTRPADVARPHRRISLRLRLRPVHLPVAVHEIDEGRHIGRMCARASCLSSSRLIS